MQLSGSAHAIRPLSEEEAKERYVKLEEVMGERERMEEEDEMEEGSEMEEEEEEGRSYAGLATLLDIININADIINGVSSSWWEEPSGDPIKKAREFLICVGDMIA